MGIIATFTSGLSVEETITVNAALLTDPSITHNHGTTKTLNSTSTPAGTKVASGQIALVDGAATLDLSAVPSKDNVTVNGTGLTVQSVKFIVPGENAITVEKGGTNGYDGLGTAFSEDSGANGGEENRLTMGHGSAIGSGNKPLDLTGTGTDVLQYIIVFG